jgi:hypothetical protein
MSDCATNGMLRFETDAALALEAAFDGGRLTSHGGLLWLSKMESKVGLCEAIAARVELLVTEIYPVLVCGVGSPIKQVAEFLEAVAE